MKKLLFVLRDLNVGGTETSLVNLLDNIDYSKYEVDLVLEKKQGVLLDRVNENVNVIDYNLSSNKVIFIRKIINYLKKIKFVNSHKNYYDFTSCYATYSMLGNYLSRKLSLNNSIFIHGDYVLDLESKDKIKQFFDCRNLDDFKRIIFVSNESRKRLIEYYPEIENKSIVFNNFINYQDIINKSLEKIKEVPSKKQLVYVGRLDENVKRITRIIDVLKTNKNYSLFIVGDGEDRELIKDYISENNLDDRCLMLGNKINPYPYIRMSNYLMMASRNEGFPMTYLEAIVLKTKIISTMDVSDEYISIPNRFGYIVNYDNYVNEVDNILNNDTLELEEFDYEKINKKKIRVIEEIFDGVEENEV